MYIRLLAPFALYLFVFTSHVVEVNGGYPYEIPANSSSKLYLVGYSSELNHSNIKCVNSYKSEYGNATGGAVRRILSMFVYNKTTNKWDMKGFVIFISITEDPLIFSINITEKTGGLVNLTGALPSYKVIHYDNDTMILANKFATIGEQALCSLWVTNDYFREKEADLPPITLEYWHSNCKNATLVPYPDDCFP